MKYTKYRILTSGQYNLDFEKFNILWVNEYGILFTMKAKQTKEFLRRNLSKTINLG